VQWLCKLKQNKSWIEEDGRRSGRGQLKAVIFRNSPLISEGIYENLD